jgi:hypothetical protein
LTSGAKPYYLAGTYVFLLGAGAAAAEPAIVAGVTRIRRVAIATTVSVACTVAFVLPVVPMSDIGFVHAINPTPAETVGWPRLVATVDGVWRSLPVATRRHAVVFTSNYGEAGAVDELGAKDGLPSATSGHNTFWWWGPGRPDATTVVAVSGGPMSTSGYEVFLRTLFRHVRVAATISDGVGVDNQEQGGHVDICTDPRRPWGTEWAQVRHDD